MTKTKTSYAPRDEWRGQHVHVQLEDGRWQEVHGVRGARLERELSPAEKIERTMTGAGRRLTSWLRALGPRRQLLGLEPTAPAPYRPHNRARMAKRRARRHMVARSRRANR